MYTTLQHKLHTAGFFLFYIKCLCVLLALDVETEPQGVEKIVVNKFNFSFQFSCKFSRISADRFRL